MSAITAVMGPSTTLVFAQFAMWGAISATFQGVYSAQTIKLFHLKVNVSNALSDSLVTGLYASSVVLVAKNVSQPLSAPNVFMMTGQLSMEFASVLQGNI